MSRQRWAVVVFPGSNSDHDLIKAFRLCPQVDVVYHWYEDEIKPGDYQVIGLPGGFSFGDYLRAGAIAKLSPAIQSLPEAVEAGAHVIGICNGFQILLEMRMLPGYLQMNEKLKFISRSVECEIQSEIFPWFKKENEHQKIRLPIAHRFGNYQCSPLDRSEIQVALRYSENPNGSLEAIAGIYRQMGKGSLLGLMPHPERSSYEDIGVFDSQLFWKNAQEALA